MTIDDILDGVLATEKAGEPPYWDGVDPGGRTSWGISERWHPDLWNPGPPTKEQARARLTDQYVKPWDWVLDMRLRAQLVDFSVLQGVGSAVRALQRILELDVDGVIGPETRQNCPRHFDEVRHVNNELIAERLVLEVADMEAHVGQRKYNFGWDRRIVSFYWR